MVVPPPIAEPWTAATIGLSKLTNASINRACGMSPDAGGFFRKSTTSLPAQKESPAPCQSTARTCSSFAAALRSSARVTYMATVIAFFFSGRFNWIRRMLPERSVRMSLMACILSVQRRPRSRAQPVNRVNHLPQQVGVLLSGRLRARWVVRREVANRCAPQGVRVAGVVLVAPRGQELPGALARDPIGNRAQLVGSVRRSQASATVRNGGGEGEAH